MFQHFIVKINFVVTVVAQQYSVISALGLRNNSTVWCWLLRHDNSYIYLKLYKDLRCVTDVNLCINCSFFYIYKEWMTCQLNMLYRRAVLTRRSHIPLWYDVLLVFFLIVLLCVCVYLCNLVSYFVCIILCIFCVLMWHFAAFWRNKRWRW